jgi:protein-S-isoprenylcysteine O-methyltransferase Ste14
LESKGKRPIPLLDVVFGCIGAPLFFTGIFYGLDTWLSSPSLISYPWNLIGIIPLIIGVFLTFWIYKITLDIPKKPILVTWGPWAHIRHPIYLTGLLVLFGLAIFIGTTLLFIAGILYEILIETPREERNLRKIFPDEYDEYSKRVPSWIPRIRK